jgi:hypothetical protein
MALSVTPAIPASQVVNVIPSVLSAGGTALDLTGLILTQSIKPPIGQVLEFATAEDVEAYFGPTTQEAALATIYFLGPDNATAQPGVLKFAQYPVLAVGAYLRGGSMVGTSLAALQAISGTLSVTIDGSPVSNAINLSAVTSFSNAADSIATSLGLFGPQTASIVGTIGATFTGSTSGTTLTVTAVASGVILANAALTGSTGGNALPAGCKVLAQLTGTLGSTGTYLLSAAATPGNMSSTTITDADTTLVVTSVNSGTLGIFDRLNGTGLTAGTYVAAQLSGTVGGVGHYQLNNALTVASETMIAFAPAVYYDSVLAAFVIASSTTGLGSTLAFATGTPATSLHLTQATGAVLSQGAVATDPNTFMDALVDVTLNWASFMTTWEPVDDDKILFAGWVNGKNNRFVYEMWDTNVLDTETGGPGPAPAAIVNGNYSGTSLVYEDPTIDTVGGELAAFGMSWIGSLDFTRTNGRQTAKFKSQSGLAGQIFNATKALKLGEYGINFYGDYTTDNDEFRFYANGSITGPFVWKDSYVNQIWLNKALQLAILNGLVNTPSIPYNTPGYALIESFCMDPINAAVNFGAIVAGVTLSAAQIAQMNNSAGLRIDNTIVNRGWYLQIKPATAQVRIARTSPPCTLWYSDGGAIHQLLLASIEIQ